MTNPYKGFAVLVVGALSVGALSIYQPRDTPPDPSLAPRLAALYAAPVERVETHVLERGETLSGVLARARITGQEMAELVLRLREHYNPNRLAAGAEVTVRRWARDGEPRTVDVRLSADTTVRLARAGIGWNSEVVVTPTVLDTVYAAGVIGAGQTLYEVIVTDETSRLPGQERYRLVNELASIYDFKLNFAREIQPGDSYRVVYEREVRPDGTSRRTLVLAAEIVTREVSYPAIWFDAGGHRGYFDREARSLATGFSKYPVAFPRITSSFNPNRYHPILGTYRAHQGTDFGAATGTPVQATADGTVTFAGVNGGYGNMVEIRHVNGFTTRYAHLSRFASGIRTGRRVSQKQVIGYVGATGLATAPHLHYELRRNGQAMNAMTAKLPEAPALAGAARTQFMSVAEIRLALLDRIPAGAFYAETGESAGLRSTEEL